MVGAGVYTTSGFSLAMLQTPERVIAAWAVGGVIAICGAISYGALAGRFAQSGGEYLFLSRAVHPAAGYVAGFVSILAGFTGATAFAASALESYLPRWTWMESLPPGTVACLVIIIAAISHGVYARVGTPLQNAMVVTKFIMLGIFFVVAAASFPDRWEGLNVPSESAFEWSVFAVSLMWISLSYSGFNAAIYVASEVRNPQINVPRSLWIATLVVTLLYLLLNIVFVYAPARESIVGQKEIAVITAISIGGENFGSFIRAVIVVSLATSVSAMMMSGPRVYAKMADDGVLPQWFRFQRDTPSTAIALQALLAIAVVQVSTLQELLSYLGFTLSLSAALTVASIFLLRSKGKPIAVPFYPWPPLVFVVATVMVAGIAGFKQPVECVCGLVTLGVGLVIYYVTPRSRLGSSHGNDSVTD